MIDFTLYIDKSQGRIRERTIVMRTAASKKLNTYTSVLWISSRTLSIFDYFQHIKPSKYLIEGLKYFLPVDMRRLII